MDSLNADDATAAAKARDRDSQASYIGSTRCEDCGARFLRVPPFTGPRHVCPDCY